MINWELLYESLLKVKVSPEGEKHHSVPKHDGGTDEDGIVLLDRRYHTLAHYIRYRWKKQLGDKVAYQMMLGQTLNPMHDKEVLEQHRKYMKSEKRREIARKKALENWANLDIRNKKIDGRRKYINSLETLSTLTKHLNTPENKQKSKIARKVYYESKGGMYVVENSKEVRQFSLKMDLVREMKVDTTTVDKHVNTGKEVKRGSLKGYKIFNFLN
jgi:hypothetical protein